MDTKQIARELLDALDRGTTIPSIAARNPGFDWNEAYQVLAEILKLRAEKSSLLGFRDWADYITADKMIGSGDRCAEFIEKVWKLEPAATADCTSPTTIGRRTGTRTICRSPNSMPSAPTTRFLTT